jgi:hypothetical protein
MATWGNEPHLLRLRVFGAVTFAKFLVTACLGEARHFYSNGPGAHGMTSDLDWDTILADTPLSKRSMRDNRNGVYLAALPMDLDRLLDTIEGCIGDFRGRWASMDDGDWRAYRKRGLNTSCSYGGPKWFEASKVVRDLVVALRDFVQAPCDGNWTRVATNYNIAVNMEHNGGRLLNKWLQSHLFDNATNAPGLFLLNGVAMRVVVNEHPALCTGEELRARYVTSPDEIPLDIVRRMRGYFTLESTRTGADYFGIGGESNLFIPKSFLQSFVQDVLPSLHTSRSLRSIFRTVFKLWATPLRDGGHYADDGQTGIT